MDKQFGRFMDIFKKLHINIPFAEALKQILGYVKFMKDILSKKLKLGEAHCTTVTLQLANRSLTHPRVIIEDVLVKVDKFIFPANFIILDMQEEKKVPIILGRPFLATGRVMIDVQKGELRLRVQEEEVTFNVFNAIKHPHDTDSCFRVDMLEAIVSSQLVPSEPLETSLTHDDPYSCEDETVQEYVKWMDSFYSNRRKYFESLGASPSQLTPSIEKPPIVEEKQLPNHLRYAYLGEDLHSQLSSHPPSLTWRRRNC